MPVISFTSSELRQDYQLQPVPRSGSGGTRGGRGRERAGDQIASQFVRRLLSLSLSLSLSLFSAAFVLVHPVHPVPGAPVCTLPFPPNLLAFAFACASKSEKRNSQARRRVTWNLCPPHLTEKLEKGEREGERERERELKSDF